MRPKLNETVNEIIIDPFFQILETFLTIPQIYSVQYVRDKYEEIARSNITSEITELKKMNVFVSMELELVCVRVCVSGHRIILIYRFVFRCWSVSDVV